MNQQISQSHYLDGQGNPAGGTTSGTGISISWQNGPLALLPGSGGFCACDAEATWAYGHATGKWIDISTPADEVPDLSDFEHFCAEHGPNSPARKPPNGAFVEGVILAALGRLEFYQELKFRCRENALAITKLEEALHWLGHRTAAREARGVEGTHQA